MLYLVSSSSSIADIRLEPQKSLDAEDGLRYQVRLTLAHTIAAEGSIYSVMQLISRCVRFENADYTGMGQ